MTLVPINDRLARVYGDYIAAAWVLIAVHEREILGGPTSRGNAIRINVNGNRNIMLKVSQ